ncbi:hypothetical protein HN011_010339 [Eciton burchellii]|nr:hypothetical protein HN011_010339 [Eciton burchellii]
MTPATSGRIAWRTIRTSSLSPMLAGTRCGSYNRQTTTSTSLEKIHFIFRIEYYDPLSCPSKRTSSNSLEERNTAKQSRGSQGSKKLCGYVCTERLHSSKMI